MKSWLIWLVVISIGLPLTSCSDDTETPDTSVECGPFEITASLSTAISTVGIVEWSATDLVINNAYIEFGLDEEYGKQAPVDLQAANFRTLLLGMKPSTEYHYRIVVSDGSETTNSCDNTLTTGPVPNGLPTASVSTYDSVALEGGYTVSTYYMTGETFIIDGDGDYVWWYFPDMAECSRARMSFDGKHMLVRNVNVLRGKSDTAIGKIVKTSMDGLEEETFSLDYSHHDFTVLPSGSVVFIEYDGVDCDNIMELDSDGNTSEILHIADVITPPETLDGCHSNAINYMPDEDAFTVSLLGKNQIIKFSRTGELLWVLGGDENVFSGDDVSWMKQHGHHIYDDKIIFFNNGEIEDPSRALIFSIDESNWEAELTWEYTSGNGSFSLGDTQHLQGGNLMVTFSDDGVIHEVDSQGNLLQEISWSLGSGLGYATRRQSLYGPPPK